MFSRQTRYVLVALLLLFGVIFLLYPSTQPVKQDWNFRLHDPDLPKRIQLSHNMYDTVLTQRAKFITQYGPHPKDIENFPPDKPPWPPFTIWDFFLPAFNCPHEVYRLGSLGDGGKWVCGMTRLAEKPNCVVYSFGLDDESSFEAELLTNTRNCTVWGYDPKSKSFGSKIPRTLSHRTHFSPDTLSGFDKGAKSYTLETLMKMNGHTHIDLLKIDIEGWEFDTVANLLRPYIESGKPLPFGQLSMEIHLWDKSFESVLAWWEMLEEAGLRPFRTEPNMVYLIYNKKGTPDLAEYSFLNVKGDNIFVKNPPQEPRAVRDV